VIPAYILAYLRRDDVTPDATFIDLGLDDVDRMTLRDMIETETLRDMSDATMEAWQTMADVAATADALEMAA